MTREQLEPVCQHEWDKVLPKDRAGTFEEFLARVMNWAIDNPTLAERSVDRFNKGLPGEYYY